MRTRFKADQQGKISSPQRLSQAQQNSVKGAHDFISFCYVDIMQG